MSEKPFESWAIVEIMGHNRYAGHVSEQTIGGQSFVRVDVPEVWFEHSPIVKEKREAFTKLFGAGSIYCITPVSEATARAMVRQLRQRPMNVYDIQELARIESRSADSVLDESDDRTLEEQVLDDEEFE